MQLTTRLLGLFIAVILFAGCKDVEFKKTKGGMPYKLYPSKEGAKVEPGKIIKMHLEQKLNDSVVYSTFGRVPVYFPFSSNSQPYDFTEVLPELKAGDSVYTVQMIDTFINRNPSQLNPMLKKGDRLVSVYKIVQVFNTAEEGQKDEEQEKQRYASQEDKALTEHLSKNNIKAEKTGVGTYVQVLEPGSGEQVVTGKEVSVMYRGATIAGKPVDTNMDTSGLQEPLKFVVDQSPMIPGLQEGIKILREGAKANIYIPSMLAYGQRGSPPVVAPYEHLVFFIEVLDVKDAPPLPNPNTGSPNNQ